MAEQSTIERVSPQLAVGLAGWSYPDWRDTVYRLPSAYVQPDLFGNVTPLKARYADDELAFIANFVDMLEVNSSFYRIPTPKTVRSWTTRTAHRPKFFFTAKLNQAFTHEFQRDHVLVSQFLQAFDPMISAGVLRGILCQFRYDFADSADAREHLSWIARHFGCESTLIAEVRHCSWQSPDALRFLYHHGFVVANLDYPLAGDSFNPRALATPDLAYLRLHGRNRQGWFASEKDPHEPYNYDYSDHEVKELSDRSEEILGKTKQLVIVANNHYRGKAVSVAARLRAELLKRNVPIPDALVDTYPALARIKENE